jgi:hypothetical protein
MSVSKSLLGIAMLLALATTIKADTSGSGTGDTPPSNDCDVSDIEAVLGEIANIGAVHEAACTLQILDDVDCDCLKLIPVSYNDDLDCDFEVDGDGLKVTLLEKADACTGARPGTSSATAATASALAAFAAVTAALL